MKHLELFTQSLPCCDLDVQAWFCKFKSLLPGYLPAFPLLLLSCLLMCFVGFVGISERWNTGEGRKASSFPEAPSQSPDRSQTCLFLLSYTEMYSRDKRLKYTHWKGKGYEQDILFCILKMHLIVIWYLEVIRETVNGFDRLCSHV